MLIIVEGPDGAGKSTLAKQIQELRPSFGYIHHGPYAGMGSSQLAKTFAGSMKPAIRGDNLIMDRCWISEPIYAEVFRNSPSRITAVQQRMLERLALQAQAKVVLCLPKLETCIKAFNSRDEMLDNAEQLAQVYSKYIGVLNTDLPVFEYDFEVETAEELLNTLYGTENEAEVVIVAGGSNPRHDTQVSVPYVSFRESKFANWLAEQLDDSGVPEYKLKWYNAYEGPMEASPVSLPHGLPVVALGLKAADWCKRHHIHYEYSPSPATHALAYGNKPYPLITILKGLLK